MQTTATNGADDFDQKPTSTVGGDYALPTHDEDDPERRAWAKRCRRARVQRGKDEPW